MADIILCNLSDANEIINEARLDWINDVFDTLQIPEDVFNVADIREYRLNMNDLGIEVLLHANGDVDVYKKIWHETRYNAGWLPVSEEQLVAQWKTPKRTMRVQGKNLYYEIQLNEWAITNFKK